MSFSLDNVHPGYRHECRLTFIVPEKSRDRKGTWRNLEDVKRAGPGLGRGRAPGRPADLLGIYVRIVVAVVAAVMRTVLAVVVSRTTVVLACPVIASVPGSAVVMILDFVLVVVVDRG